MKTLTEINDELDRILQGAIDIQKMKDFDVLYMGRLIGAGQALMWVTDQGSSPTTRALVNKTLQGLRKL